MIVKYFIFTFLVGLVLIALCIRKTYTGDNNTMNKHFIDLLLSQEISNRFSFCLLSSAAISTLLLFLLVNVLQ